MRRFGWPIPVRADLSPAARASRPPCPHGGRDFVRRPRAGPSWRRARGGRQWPFPWHPERRMADLKEARVPDIGGYDDVPVIEVLVSVGDTVDKDQGLVTLESDKATMEVPSPFAGVIKELKVKVGDTLSEGGVVAVIEPAAGQAAATASDETAKPRSEERRVGKEG